MLAKSLNIMLLLALVLGLSVLRTAVSGSDRFAIQSLPGWSPKPMPSNQYSGFVDSNAAGSIKMHFWFVESEGDPSTDPLILWFNGGM
jgi:hypothetical protein